MLKPTSDSITKVFQDLNVMHPVMAAIVWAVYCGHFGAMEQALAAELLFQALSAEEQQYCAILRNGNLEHKKELRDLLESERKSWYS